MGISLESELLITLEKLYASVLDDVAWGDALMSLARLVSASGSVVMYTDPGRSTVTRADPYGVDPEVNNAFMQYYASKDIRIPGCLTRPVGELIIDRSVISYENLRKSEIYNDLLLPNDVPYIMGVWLKKSTDLFISLSLQAGIKRGPFTDSEGDLFKKVLPHLERVMQVRSLLLEARFSTGLSKTLISNLPIGVLTLNAQGHVMSSVGIAEDILREGLALRYLKQRLRAAFDDDDRAMHAAITAATVGGRNARVGATVSIKRPFVALPLTICIIPVIYPDFLDSFLRPVCLILVVDPDRNIQAQSEIIQRSLGLTPAEGRLALAIFNGLSIREAAASLGRSYNTCKSQAKMIFSKTGCASQAELVKKIMTVCFAPLTQNPNIWSSGHFD